MGENRALMREAIADRLRAVRESIEKTDPAYSARGVSAMLGQANNWVQNRESGRTKVTLPDVRRLAAVYRMSPLDLIRGTDADICSSGDAEGGAPVVPPPQSPKEPDGVAWMKMAQDLMAQLSAQDATARLRIEKVESVHAQANLDLAAAARLAVEKAANVPHSRSRPGPGRPSQEPPTGTEE